LCASVSTTDSTNIRGYYDRLHHTAVEPFSFVYRTVPCGTTGGVICRVAKSNETSEDTEFLAVIEIRRRRSELTASPGSSASVFLYRKNFVSASSTGRRSFPG
jgi:hypothetical protein